MTARFVLLSCLITALLPARGRAAETSTESRLRDALRAATAQVQTLEDERARWQATDAGQKKELESLRAKLASAGAAPRPSARNDRELADLSRRLSDQADAGAKLAGDLARCQATAKEAGEAARSKEEERSQLGEKLGTLNDRISTCEARNARMYAVAKEVLDRYQKMGLGDAIGSKEPFLGLRRVELENLAQDYGDKLLDQQVAR